MSFQGSLRELQLADIVQLFSSSGKTGKFALVNDDETGELYLKQGRIVHAQVADLAGDEAVYVLASWSSGDFSFTPDAETDRVTVQKSNTRLLMEAAHQHDEWRVLARKIPGLSAVPTLRSPEAGRPVTLSPGEWRQIVAIDGRKNIRELASESGNSSFEVAKTLYGLITEGLVEMRPPARERTPSSRGGEAHPRHTVYANPAGGRVRARRAGLGFARGLPAARSRRDRERGRPGSASRARCRNGESDHGAGRRPSEPHLSRKDASRSAAPGLRAGKEGLLLLRPLRAALLIFASAAAAIGQTPSPTPTPRRSPGSHPCRPKPRRREPSRRRNQLRRRRRARARRKRAGSFPA